MSGVLVAIALAIAGVASGISGFGFALVSLTFLSLLVDVKAAVAFLVVHTLSVNVIQIFSLRQHFQLRAVLPMIIGAVAGVPVGVSLLKSVDATVIQKALGVFVVIFVLQQVINPGANKTVNSNLVKGGVGLSGGVLMGAFLSGGPPIVMYSLKAGDNKYQAKVNMQTFFVFSNIYALGLYLFTGLLTFDLFMESTKFLPVSIIGTFFGIRLFNIMSGDIFRKIVYLLLLCLGVAMLFK
ncbi:MAG: sulfite exporter TauE/SafE family protein [Firmicutes bacterium]|nr:sulfite exporter TauE/SafE family protein [Bacillota bacterium]